MTYNWYYLLRDQSWKRNELEVEREVELGSTLAFDTRWKRRLAYRGDEKSN
jgi:hypothetical protein